MEDPFDHNRECRYCDDLLGHTANCSWLLALISENERLLAENKEQTVRIAQLESKLEFLYKGH